MTATSFPPPPSFLPPCSVPLEDTACVCVRPSPPVIGVPLLFFGLLVCVCGWGVFFLSFGGSCMFVCRVSFLSPDHGGAPLMAGCACMVATFPFFRQALCVANAYPFVCVSLRGLVCMGVGASALRAARTCRPSPLVLSWATAVTVFCVLTPFFFFLLLQRACPCKQQPHDFIPRAPRCDPHTLRGQDRHLPPLLGVGSTSGG